MMPLPEPNTRTELVNFIGEMIEQRRATVEQMQSRDDDSLLYQARLAAMQDELEKMEEAYNGVTES